MSDRKWMLKEKERGRGAYKGMEGERHKDGDTIKAETTGRIHTDRKKDWDRMREREVLDVGKGGHRCLSEH